MKSYAEMGIIPNIGDKVFVLKKRASFKTDRGYERRNPTGTVGVVKSVSDTCPVKILVSVPVPIDVQKAFGRTHTSEWRTTDRIGVLG